MRQLCNFRACSLWASTSRFWLFLFVGVEHWDRHWFESEWTCWTGLWSSGGEWSTLCWHTGYCLFCTSLLMFFVVIDSYEIVGLPYKKNMNRAYWLLLMNFFLFIFFKIFVFLALMATFIKVHTNNFVLILILKEIRKACLSNFPFVIIGSFQILHCKNCMIVKVH